MRIVITTPDGATKIKTVTSLAELRAEFPNNRISWSGPITDAQLISNGLDARVSVEVAEPALAYGQTATADDERQIDGTWLQTWSVQSITLAQAKQQLAVRIAEIYADKVTSPTPAQLLADGYVNSIQTRDTNFKPTLDDIAARVQAASTIAEAKAISDELDAL